MKTTIEFRQAVHEVMIDMALDCTFPEDMNDLCIATIFEKANEALDKDGDYRLKVQRERMVENLSHYICEDEDRYAGMEEALTLLEEQSEIDGSVDADDIVLVWEQLEGNSVDFILDQI